MATNDSATTARAGIDLEAIRARAARAYDFAQRQEAPPHTKLEHVPLSVREHFESDVPALLARLAEVEGAAKNALDEAIALGEAQLRVIDQRDKALDHLAAVRKLHEPTLQIVEWFHDQTGRGEALCCPSCRPADPTTNWHPPVGEAGIEPEGFVPRYVLSPCPTLAALPAEAI